MAYRTQAAFSAGELDPALWERTTLDKYNTGLAVCRNAYIGKTGRITSRPGTLFQVLTKNPSEPSIVYSPPYSQYVIEWGNLYVRVYTYINENLTLSFEAAHTWVTSQLPNIQFAVTAGNFLYVSCKGFTPLKLYYGPSGPNYPQNARFFTPAQIFTLPPPPVPVSSTHTGSGYPVDYAITYIIDGLESDYVEFLNTDSGYLLPQAAGEENTIIASAAALYPSTQYPHISGFNIYRRPSFTGAYGFIGSAPAITISASCFFNDVGGTPDYTHSPPSSIVITEAQQPHANPITAVTCAAIAIYQQRLLMSDDSSPEAVRASRIGFQNSFFFDTPLDSAGAITFETGTTGSAVVTRIVDSLLGLIVYTTIGIFQNSGLLDFSNLSLARKGTIVIQPNVPPIDLPGGATIVVDRATNSVRSLIYSFIEQAFPTEELSIFSNHLFEGKQVLSWAFQDGSVPLIWMVMSDGTLVSLTYQRESQMQAFTRHDTEGGLFESITILKDLNAQSIVHLVVNRNGVRSIETLAPRGLNNAGIFTTDLKQYIGMDAAVRFNDSINDAVGGATFSVVAQDYVNWAGLLNVTSLGNIAAFVDAPGEGAVGSVFKFFDEEGSAVVLTVTQYIGPTQVVVQPDVEYPSNWSGTGTPTLSPTLFYTYTTLTGLDQLNGQEVAVLADGAVVSSPNNDVEQFPTLIVENGQLTLPPQYANSAYVNIGIPMTVDVQTLDIDTVEQKPTLLESKIINKVWIKVYHSRGMFVGQNLLDNNSVYGMENPEDHYNSPETGNIGNAPIAPYTKRYGIAIPNEWGFPEKPNNGKIAIRQVDPLPLEILSIIPDLQPIV